MRIMHILVLAHTSSRFFSFSLSRLLFLYSCIFTLIGSRRCLYLPHTVESKVANIWPTSAITDRVNGMPTMANRRQKTRPAVVTGAMLPYPKKQNKKLTN